MTPAGDRTAFDLTVAKQLFYSAYFDLAAGLDVVWVR
jgi:hypothetical protein